MTHAVINLDLPGPTISRHLYGHFAEHLGRCVYGGFWVGEDSPLPNVGGIRSDVVEALRAIRIPNLRWPGGCFADEYHWRDGVGPRGQRPRMVNTHWGNVEENNHFGTHEFMHLCELLGADAYVNGNVGSGTVREMSDWVEYLTRAGDSPMVALRKANGRDEPWRVPFWGIGNEAWGCGGNLTAEAYTDLARQFGTFVRDHGDNRVYRIAAGGHTDEYGWTEALMKARGPYQAVSLHYYTTFPGDGRGGATTFTTEHYYDTMRRAQRIEELIRGHETVMDRYDPQVDIGLVVDEWGTWWDVEDGTNPGFLYQQNTMRDALVASVHFDAFHRHARRVVMANIAQTVNVLQAMLLTEAETGTLIRTPTYHVFEMNVGHHDARALAVHFRDGVPNRDGLDLVSASASTQNDTALVSLTNLDAEAPRTVLLDLRGREVSAHRARVLTGSHLQAHNTADAPDAVAPTEHPAVRAHPRGLEVDLPPHSYVTVHLDLGAR
ncbi:alpha-L-arabinofuranosidase C-terminal domain-containing protein [Virgisporangium ochraceum]|uniref:non-reducing end alpha-L-arabinofuranosidase n=1 Tax=Virgisporangium ochraceum TaxID=65505 RepID=A0A8J3ZXR3_9ACTN|nr:alpha-L-arabinofuranosidase C-terminal domain-containing protein [Virgisporangium ochraceum]GIJ71118.1 alpha-N-arabinofuranosidase [Virgisporangium ochraceum]